ncbi:GlxA family transcriptional regulator [Phaeacidiphilus oryzae]|uniref:GlxA family transcriptional regulator n=1 Tax=Phaeacidiphilus oryzae TaxID=348818 RepID=UPI00056A386B|nr:helix-turn-helix domain-containing protein [Phaeacidiphilus oryzae]
MPHRVVVLALDGVIPFELGIPNRIFESQHITSSPGDPPLYEVVTASLAPGRPIRTTSDFRIVADEGPDALATADTVVVPAAYEPPELFERGELSAELGAALAHIRPGARLVSICTGSFVLAAAGLLDGRPATTHWRYGDTFRRLFPKVLLDPEVLFVDDGDVLTSGGVAAGVDLCLHILRRDHGSAAANRVARQCLVPPWRAGGQSQYVERPVPPAGQAAEGTAPARAWARERLRNPLELSELAARCGMSVRTFTRRFRAETGLSPGQWLVRERVELARELLEAGESTIERIARETGFGTATSLRNHFEAQVGVSPSAYRRTFQLRR